MKQTVARVLENRRRLLQLMRILRVVSLILLTYSFNAWQEVQAQGLQFIYDGRNDPQPLAASNSEVQMIRRFALPKARQHWRSDKACQESFEVVGAANGSFTKPKATQRAVLYRFCVTGHDFANNGIVIFEDAKIVTHVVFNGGEDHYLGPLADITGDGLSKLLLADNSMHQGYTNSVITIIELSSSGVKTFGIAETYDDDCGAIEKGCREQAHRIVVNPGYTPIFYQEIFRKKGRAWIKIGNPTRFSPRPDESQYELLN